MLELLVGLLEILLEVLLEAALEFAAESLGAAILRSVSAIFDTSEFKNPILAAIGYVFFRWGRRWT
jgi:hypothetical protein